MKSHELEFLRETLHAQQQLLQKLYNELDEERECSAIAADQTMSMILRLQREKAAMEMEANQYKRIAEEKMCYAQETLEILQELIYQKQIEIASLEFQVHAYKFKLASLSRKTADSVMNPFGVYHDKSGKVNKVIQTYGDSQCLTSAHDKFEVSEVSEKQEPDSILDLKTGNEDLNLEELKRMIKKLEHERFVRRGREISLEAGDEELKILREMMEKVEALEHEITSWRTKKPPEPEDADGSFGWFNKVMQCFLP
ncbi:myosin-binding protein 1-like [Silene latifolia]|uniref:myosin-binding protein 1-like n=1 Tax=Silene latifolia TaxID=37657 RepID=UPI003D774DDA